VSKNSGQKARPLLDRLTNHYVRRLRLTINDLVDIATVRDQRLERQVSFWHVLVYLGPVLVYLESRHVVICLTRRSWYRQLKYRLALAVAMRARELYGPKYASPCGENLRYLGIIEEEVEEGTKTELDVYIDTSLVSYCITAIGIDRSSHIPLGEISVLGSLARQRYFTLLSDLQPIIGNGRRLWGVEFRKPEEWARMLGHPTHIPWWGWADDSPLRHQSMRVKVSKREYLCRAGYPQSE
jgi:hypothetical protein